jgi:hypothetical protein
LGKLLASRYVGEDKLRGDMVWSIAARVLVTVMFLVLGEARAAADGAPHACRIGLYVTALGDFDLEASSFGADLRLWSLCPAGAGDVRPLATADLTNGIHVARGEIRTELQGDRIYARQRITGRFWHHWHVVTFPFDRHRLDITVEDTVLDRSLFRYEPDTVQSGLSPGFHLPGWRVAGFEVVEEPHPYPTTLGNPSLEEGQTLSRFRTSIFLERHDYMGFVKLTAALYAATLIALLAFFSDPNHPSIYGGRMSLIVGALFAVVVNLHTSDRALGDTPEITLMAQLHIAGAGLIVAVALVTVWHRRRAEQGRPAPHPHWALLVSLLVVFVAVNAFLVARAAAVTPAAG